MERVVRIVRNLAFLVLLMVAAAASEKKVFAVSCGSIFIGMDSVYMEHCGPFYYEGGAGVWMYTEAKWRCQAYCGLSEAYLYYSYREGDFQDEAYWTSSWYCGG